MKTIISIPRSGATQFCIDYADKHGLTWRGELWNEMCPNIGMGRQSAIKRNHHESGHRAQPAYETVSQYFTALKDPNSLWLVNSINDVSGHLPDALGVMLRKNYIDSFYSQAQVFTAQEKHFGSIWWVNQWAPYVTNLSLILDWILRFPTPVVWYEDYFPNMNRQYTVTEAQKTAIFELCERFSIENKMKRAIKCLTNTEILL